MSRENEKNIKIIRICLTILAVIAIVGIIIYLFPVMKDLSSIEGQTAFKEKVENSGGWGILMLFGLQAAQIFLFIIPGEPIEILAGMCYGALWGTVFIMVSNFIVSVVIFWMVRKLGRNFVYSFYNEEKISKIENSKLFQNPKKIEYIILVLFLLPGTPKDLLVYISGLLPIRFRKFIIISTFARIPSVISSTIAGANMAVGDWKTSIILYLIIFFVFVLFIYIINKFDKDKTTEDALKIVAKK